MTEIDEKIKIEMEKVARQYNVSEKVIVDWIFDYLFTGGEPVSERARKAKSLIISHKTTKRRIDGPFGICGDSRVLRNIADQILRELNKRGDGYGWIDLFPNEEQVNHIPSESPVDWE